MFRHPHYLELPWDIQDSAGTTGPHRHLWWLIAPAGPVGHVSDRRGRHIRVSSEDTGSTPRIKGNRGVMFRNREEAGGYWPIS